jgi:hypothetical protein
MKLIQQQSIPGQPPEKKLRVTGGFTNGSDASNYDYQVNRIILFQFHFNFYSFSREILINNDISLFCVYINNIYFFVNDCFFFFFSFLSRIYTRQNCIGIMCLVSPFFVDGCDEQFSLYDISDYYYSRCNSSG